MWTLSSGGLSSLGGPGEQQHGALCSGRICHFLKEGRGKTDYVMSPWPTHQHKASLYIQGLNKGSGTFESEEIYGRSLHSFNLAPDDQKASWSKNIWSVLLLTPQMYFREYASMEIPTTVFVCLNSCFFVCVCLPGFLWNLHSRDGA